ATGIVTNWGQLNFPCDNGDNPSGLQLSDDGRFVIYRLSSSIYFWENNSEPVKVLDIIPNNGEQGSLTNPGNKPKLSPDGQYFSLHWDSYMPPKPVYVYSLRDGSSSAVANCDSHDFAHKSSELICSNHDNVTIVDLETNEVVRTFKSDVVPAKGIYYSPSDKFVMQYCSPIVNQGITYCDDGDVKIQVTNLETGLSHYPEIVDSPSHYERIKSGGFIYGDHTMFFGVEYYFIDKEGSSTAQDENMIVLFGQDSDDDDVFDIYDECPKTSLMIGIDSNGCSSSQRDSDNDGLVDSLDQCPDTENGILVDDVGCWWGQFDTDGDGVQNSEDLCPESRSNSCEIPSKWHLSERSVVLRQCTQEQILSCEEDSSLTGNYDPQFNAISEIEYSPDGLLFATILNRDSVMIFESQSKNQVGRINISSAQGLSFSNDGTILAVGGNANISLWETSSWQQIGLIGEEDGDHINKISFSADGRYLAYANTYPYVTRVIDLSDNSSGEGLFCHSRCAIVHNFTSPYNRIYSMDFSPDGSHFAISTQVDILGEFDVGLIVFETTNWSVEFTDAYGQITDPPEGWSQSYDNIRDLQFSTDNKWLITGSMRGDIRVYDRSDWSIVGTFEIGMYGLEDFTISPDNNHVISSTTYRSGPPVVVLDLTNGNTDSYDSPCGYGIGSTGEIWSLAISNDGSE
ncbi:MAG: WD40 repeat domain-containing protein, partial [Candidatus Poseidoniales archaeon]